VMENQVVWGGLLFRGKTKLKKGRRPSREERKISGKSSINNF